MEDPETGFKSTLFERTANGKKQYCYAYAGTDDLKDVVNDLKQFASLLSAQYELAQINAKALVNQYHLTNLTFTGHSLGGGLAALSSITTGKPAYTFNAAGLNLITKTFFSLLGRTGNIQAYINRYDPLDFAQRHVGARADGNIHIVSYTYFWNFLGLPLNHGITDVIKGIKDL
jgi:hypothetical protein